MQLTYAAAKMYGKTQNEIAHNFMVSWYKFSTHTLLVPLGLMVWFWSNNVQQFDSAP